MTAPRSVVSFEFRDFSAPFPIRPYPRHLDEEVGFAKTWLPRGELVTGSRLVPGDFLPAQTICFRHRRAGVGKPRAVSGCVAHVFFRFLARVSLRGHASETLILTWKVTRQLRRRAAQFVLKQAAQERDSTRHL